MQNKSYDSILLIIFSFITGLGFVMVASASMPITEKVGFSAFRYVISQGVYITIGTLLLLMTTFVPTKFYKASANLLLIISIILLAVLIIPGVSRPINGSVRWFLFGGFSFQPSEFAKLGFILYVASYIVRRENNLKNTYLGFLIPLGVIGLLSILLLLEPDFGTTVVVISIGLGMLFLGGVKLSRFFSLLPFITAGVVAISFSSSYRVERLLSFLNPWEDQFDTGYQLVQSLIAFGRGGFLGKGLGESVQKLHYLPEAHNDFLFAVIAEELGLVGAMFVLLLFTAFVIRAMQIGKNSYLKGDKFSGLVAYGIAIWIGLQSMINIGVNIGALPTKGITLPFMSHGGSSMLFTCIAVGILLRIDFETKCKNN